MRTYRPEWLRLDVVAGLTAAAVVIPKALAYAAIASVPLAMGLNAAVVPLLVYVVLGGSRSLSVTTTSTIAILTAAVIAGASAADPAQQSVMASTLAVLVGAILLGALLFRLAFVADFISEPVLTGFKAGIGLIIVVDQVPKLLGIHVPKGGVPSKIVAIFGHLAETHPATLVLSLLTFGLLIALPRFLPKVPAPLVAIVLGIVASMLLDFDAAGIDTVGDVPLGLPSLTPPDLSLVGSLWPAALGVALISFTETIAVGRAFAQPGEPRPRAKQELLAIGAGNVVGGLLGTMPSGGGASQTAVNARAGARTQVASAVTALVAVACLLFLGPALAVLPMATLAVVIIATSVGLIAPHEFRDILAIRRMEFAWALVAFAGVALLGTLKGILVAVVVSLLFVVAQAQNPAVYAVGRKRGTNVFRPRSDEHQDDETFDGMILLRIEARVFFANAQIVGDRLRSLAADSGAKVVVLDCSAVVDLEYTALKMLTAGEESLRSEGVLLCLAALTPEVRRVVEAAPLGRTLGRERMFFNLEHAVEHRAALISAAASATPASSPA